MYFALVARCSPVHCDLAEHIHWTMSINSVWPPLLFLLGHAAASFWVWMFCFNSPSIMSRMYFQAVTLPPVRASAFLGKKILLSPGMERDGTVTHSFRCNFESLPVTVLILIGWGLEFLEEKAILIQLLPVPMPDLCLALGGCADHCINMGRLLTRVQELHVFHTACSVQPHQNEAF